MDLLKKVTNPTRFDMAPKGSVWKHENNYWIQISNLNDHGTAEWITLGDMLSKVFQGCVLNEDFIMRSIKLLEKNEELSKADVNNILREYEK